MVSTARWLGGKPHGGGNSHVEYSGVITSKEPAVVHESRLGTGVGHGFDSSDRPQGAGSITSRVECDVGHDASEVYHRVRRDGKAFCGAAITQRCPFIKAGAFGATDEVKWCRECAERIGMKL